MKEKVALLSVLANFILAAGKIFVGVFSNSAAVLAEGLHSFMDIFASAVSYIGIRTSKRPSDEKHPYGYYKFEVLAGTIITIILLVTGGGIVYDAVRNFFSPAEITIGFLAFGIMAFSVIINEIMARIKIYFGKKENSISLLSDGVHSRVDVYASLAILLGLFFIKYWIYADSFLALLVGLYIIKESFSLGREAMDSLLDVSAGKEIEEKITNLTKEDKIELAELKTQKKGSAVVANLEIKLPNTLSVEEATKISNNLRKKMINEIESLQYVTIQITSHEVGTGFYKPVFGKSFGWQKRGRFKGEIKQAEGKGPGGYCVCPKCGYEIPHKPGTPCSTFECPKCKIDLLRK